MFYPHPHPHPHVQDQAEQFTFFFFLQFDLFDAHAHVTAVTSGKRKIRGFHIKLFTTRPADYFK